MFKTKFIVCFLAISTLLSAQKQPEHKKKFYVSPEGSLFCSKALPIYFWISNSPDEKSEKHRLKSESTPKYANPMYFDVDGRNTFRSPSAVDTTTKEVIYPKIDVQYQVYADGNAPVSKWDINNNPIFEKNKVFYTQTNEIKIAAKDDLSGIDGIMFSIDSSEYQKYNTTITLNAEKEFQLKFYAYDNTGNAENTNTLKICLDKTPSVSELKFVGDKHNDIISGNTYIEIDAKDNLSGVKRILFSLDDTIFYTYNSKIYSGNISQGQHTLKYYSIDNIENKEAVKSVDFYVDKTPPQVLEEIVGKTFYVNGKEFSAGTSRLKVSAIDNKAGVKEIIYSINNAPFEKYDKPIILSNYKGSLLIKCFAVDNVGNKGGYNAENSRNNAIPYVDIIAPWVGYNLSNPVFRTRDTIFISNKTKIMLEAKDAESGVQKIEYQIDTTDLVLYQKPFYVFDENYHKISIYGYDNTDNMTRDEFYVMVDTVGPQIYNRFSAVPLGSITEDNNLLNIYPSYVVLFISATDFCAGYESLSYKLNNLPWKNYSGDISGFAPNSFNKVVVKAIDKLGNITEKAILFRIK
jgi:hypothetical protein